MARTQFNSGEQTASTTIVRADVNTSTSGSALITKVIPGNNITITNTGTDAGTGDVTINATNNIWFSMLVEGLWNNAETVISVNTRVAFTLPASLTGSVIDALTAATASTTITLLKNGTSIGTAVFAAAGTTATLTFTTSTSFSIGDVLTITGPSTADTTLANTRINILGTSPMTSVVVILTPGTTTWTVPSDWTSTGSNLECWGPGGAGGFNLSQASEGGGSGGYSASTSVALTVGAVINTVIPAGGTGTNPCYFAGTSLATSTVGANGGSNGAAGWSVHSAGAAGATTTNAKGTLKRAGAAGGSQTSSTPTGGAGGGAPGPGGVGGKGGNSSGSAGGNGGSGNAGSGGAGGAGDGNLGVYVGALPGGDNPNGGGGGGGGDPDSQCYGAAGGTPGGGGGGCANGASNFSLTTAALGGGAQIRITYTSSAPPPPPPGRARRILMMNIL